MKNYELLARENEQSVRLLYSAFQQGDVDGVTRQLSQDVILTIPGKGLNAGEYWGHAGFKQFYSNIINYYGGKFTNEIVAFAAGDRDVFVREFNVLNRKADPSEEWQLPMVMHYRLRNGKISSMRVIPEYHELYDSYWTPGKENPMKGDDLHPGRNTSFGDAVSISQHDFMMEKYYGFWDGRYEVFKPVMGQDFIFFLPGNSALAGTYKGYEGYLAFRKKLLDITGDRYQLMIEGFAAGDKDVFVLEHIYSNTIYDETPGHAYVLMHFMLDGDKIVRANDFPLDAQAYEKFYRKAGKIPAAFSFIY